MIGDGRRRLARGIALGMVLALAACGGDETTVATTSASAKRVWRDPAVDPATTLSPAASPDTVAWLIRERDGVRSDADGKGRAWLEGEPRVEVTSPGKWTFAYECGALGIAVGGSVDLLLPYGVAWNAPQLRNGSMPGFIVVETDAEGVSLDPQIDGGHPRTRLRVKIGGRALAAGEVVRISFTSVADRSADREIFYVATDGDGDGVAKLLDESPAIETFAAAPARLVATWPSVARPGETIALRVAALDEHDNRAPLPPGVELAPLLPGLRLATALAIDAENGTARAEIAVEAEGVHAVTVRAPGLSAQTPPLVASPDVARVLWGDVHGHSNLSDGTGSPEQYFAYARDVAGMDVSALTDHDHFGAPRHLDTTPAVWESIERAVEAFDAPGRFVALLGFEWTSWLHGHRHVLYFSDRGQVLSALDARFDTPTKLWAGLRGLPALTFAHHPAGGPIATNWAFAPDPELEPLVEIVSVAGNSESPDAPRPVQFAEPGHFVRDALDGGDRLGFVGSGDSHDGHPGCPTPGDERCGLVAILAEEKTRDAVLAALRARRTYATNGPRFVLDVRLDDAPIGAVLAPAPERRLRVRVVAPRPIAKVELVRSGAVVETIAGEGRRDLSFERALADLRDGEYVYLRATQIDEGAAWSSPFFVAAEGAR